MSSGDRDRNGDWDGEGDSNGDNEGDRDGNRDRNRDGAGISAEMGMGQGWLPQLKYLKLVFYSRVQFL